MRTKKEWILIFLCCLLLSISITTLSASLLKEDNKCDDALKEGTRLIDFYYELNQLYAMGAVNPLHYDHGRLEYIQMMIEGSNFDALERQCNG